MEINHKMNRRFYIIKGVWKFSYYSHTPMAPTKTICEDIWIDSKRDVPYTNASRTMRSFPMAD